ncbi:hypothetical protein [Tepidimonas charontis]|jgi:hypothetical protein|uniref:Uncharacterized protein n=1 Tax=Tepidimonas charontis TaxID=2267262 RepID=A0A554XH28_9BURK|nr:hypothetical protein [Tepidimonas charontis]TSE35140.1 hypothetical protein Tchar_00929 [Tepidimonas charontis]
MGEILVIVALVMAALFSNAKAQAPSSDEFVGEMQVFLQQEAAKSGMAFRVDGQLKDRVFVRVSSISKLKSDVDIAERLKPVAAHLPPGVSIRVRDGEVVLQVR